MGRRRHADLAARAAPARAVTVEEAVAGDAPPAVALMRVMLAGHPAAEVVAQLRALRAARPGPRTEALAALAEEAQDGLAMLERMVAAGADHAEAADAAAGVAGAQAMFDRLARLSPEASVAAYSLGDPARLRAATGEVVDWLDGCGLLAGRPRVLDLGCGIGRLSAAVAPAASLVVGIDVSAEMARLAARRCAGLPGVAILRGGGHDLAMLRDGAFDLVLAVDVFPYLVQASPDLAARHLAEAARVLRPGGSLALMNYSYRGAEADRREMPRHARTAGFALLRNGETPFATWDGAAFWLRRA
ncbi:class I SAM-dependent methyltransferase [Falsiroseomonas sp. CW058]|uniref:class I SAM-dependent methyltransferase n=1 Tax=Falsiroseomonas sp. CW058 TaxID=3388664 RepID=UPI003D31AD63